MAAGAPESVPGVPDAGATATGVRTRPDAAAPHSSGAHPAADAAPARAPEAPPLSSAAAPLSSAAASRWLPRYAAVEVAVLLLLAAGWAAAFYGRERGAAVGIARGLLVRVYAPLRAAGAAVSLTRLACSRCPRAAPALWDAGVLAACVAMYAGLVANTPDFAALARPFAASFGKDAGTLARTAFAELHRELPFVLWIAGTVLVAAAASYALAAAWAVARAVLCCVPCRRAGRA